MKEISKSDYLISHSLVHLKMSEMKGISKENGFERIGEAKVENFSEKCKWHLIKMPKKAPVFQPELLVPRSRLELPSASGGYEPEPIIF